MQTAPRAAPGSASGIGTWGDIIFETPRASHRTLLVGVLEGEGIGPSVISAALTVLSALESATGHHFTIRYGGPIGIEAERSTGNALSEENVRFCEDIFENDGAVLAGPGGGRFVYDLRRRFDLFCKISPIRALHELAGANRLKLEHFQDVDILLVRENATGIYQGKAAPRGCEGEAVIEYS